MQFESQAKLDRVRALMDARRIDTLWLRRVENVAWITGGIDTAVNTASALGTASVVITQDDLQILTTVIEAPRLTLETDLEAVGFEIVAFPWETGVTPPVSRALGVDFPYLSAVDIDLTTLRIHLLPAEQDRFRALGVACADAMQHTIHRVRPGHSEHELAAALTYEARGRGITPLVTLVAVDNRISRFRHPLPTRAVLDRYAMLVLGGRRDGLLCSVTRLVHFGPVPADLRRRMDACAEVNAAMIAASQPGATLGDVFRIAQETYARVGFPDEWKLHHQGGIAGYTPREILAGPDNPTVLEPGMICAWNPSITGTKCEDSVLVGQSPEIVTAMYGWPTQKFTQAGLTIASPVMMELE
ncbi:MAG TPA: M24 family metallopeptidase [Aggregatilineaceae bacterium]|nr:M24 family metallopeptidase [Aggregatilineaceae bacterium]